MSTEIASNPPKNIQPSPGILVGIKIWQAGYRLKNQGLHSNLTSECIYMTMTQSEIRQFNIILTVKDQHRLNIH